MEDEDEDEQRERNMRLWAERAGRNDRRAAHSSHSATREMHGAPPPGMECLSTLEEITMENYCEYQTAP